MLLNTIEIPDDLEWTDEFTWTPIVQNSTYGATGALYIQTGTKLTGRYITLQGKDDMAWITRSTLLSLIALRDVADEEMTLTLSDEREFNVVFRQSEVPVDVRTVKGYNEFSNEELFVINAIRLMEVV